MGLRFRVLKVDEEDDVSLASHRAPAVSVERKALSKALAAAKLVRRGLVMAADTSVFAAGKALGKPRNPAEAASMLRLLSGKEHRVYTGVALLKVVNGNVAKQLVAHEVTKVKFRRLSQGEILSYVETGEPMDKAGAYGIQGKGGMLVESIEGSYENVVGLPISLVAEMLRKMGFSVWQMGGSK
jgi:septum formation protein